MYKALSVDYGNGRLLMGEARKSESSVLKEFGVDKYPTLLIIPPGKDAIVYDGELKYQPLYDYLSTYALNKDSSDKNNNNNNKQKAKGEEKMDNQEPPVKPKGK